MARRASDTGKGEATNTVASRSRMQSARTPTIDSAHEPAAASFDTDDEAAGRPAQRAAIQQALAHQGRIPVQAPGAARTALPAPLWILCVLAGAALFAWMLLS